MALEALAKSSHIPAPPLLTAGRPEYSLTGARRHLPKVRRRAVSVAAALGQPCCLLSARPERTRYPASLHSFPAWRLGAVLPTLAFLPASKAGVNLK